MEEKQDIINNYDKYAKKRQDALLKNLKPSHRFVERPMMRNMLPNLEGKKILLIGCGTGEETMLLNSFGAYSKNIVGIDISRESIKLAKNTYPSVEFKVMDMNNLEFEDESFDFVYSSLAVHYTANPEKVYKEVYRVLKKDGLFLFSLAHPLRWASQKVFIDGEECRVIGCSRNNDKCRVIGKYHSFDKQTHSFFAWQNDGEILSFYVGAPSMHFKLLRKVGFNVLDFTESKCIDEAKDIDLNYYIKNSEIPQFMAFLTRK